MEKIDSTLKHLTKALMKAVIGFLLGMLLYFGFLLLYWQFGNYQTADVKTPILVLNENNEVGEDRRLKLEFEFSKFTDVNPDVSRNIICVDDTVHFVRQNPTSGVTRPIGTFTARPVYHLEETVPTDTECFFEFTNEYQVNPIRQVTKRWFSEPFIIKE